MRRLAAAVLAVLSACVPPSQLTPEGREKVTQQLARQSRYLRVSVYVAPFFGDGSRLLVTDRPVSELRLLETPEGNPITPPAPTRILPPGTPVFVDGIQFPTGTIPWSRPLTTPRYNPWLLVTVEGLPKPAVLVLAADSARPEDVIAEVGRVVGSDDPTNVYRALPDAYREAIREKKVVDGMNREAVAMAWGFPDKIVMDRPARTEEWSWNASPRKASFLDDRLVRADTGKVETRAK
jgi:hypothetical protein